MWYRADFEITSVENPKHKDIVGTQMGDSEFFEAENDDKAIEVANSLASDGTYYQDAGDCGLKLIYLVEVDEDDEFWGEKKEPIYY